MVAKKESRTSFVNRVMGLSFNGTQGKYSYCNDETKQILFSLNSSNDDPYLILSPDWHGYSHSIKHINKVINEGYDLLVFKTKTRRNKNGEVVADGFDPYVEQRKLMSRGDEFLAVPLEITFEDVDEAFREKVIKSSNDSAEDRRKRLKNAQSKPKKIVLSAIVYDRNPDVVAEVLDRAHGCCEKCKNPAPFNRKSDGSPYLEVHHKIPLSKDGDDTVDNAIALCPNCHRELHYGRL
ncbi:HNH endonuclease [Shewanella sp. A32]|uniref:HNH endonuclease n=1 Tax=Shewanella sp. A32 TaxID=3031327 RepID=UPI0023B8F7E2|nr:HNH endonuclease [Shewanella sp. A32]MDF0536024.1 HNH endonuclease [Shewanella sp. A32]